MDALRSRWRSYFEAHADDPEPDDGAASLSATIDLLALYDADPDLAQVVLERPVPVLEAARVALRDLAESSVPVRFRVENNPHLCGVEAVSARHLRELVTVRGAVEATGPVGAVPVTAGYRCPACGARRETSPDGLEAMAPARCEECGWDGEFAFRPGDSEFVDARRVTLGPIAADEPDRRRTDSVPAYVYGDLVGAVEAGEHVGVTGILRARPREDSPLWERYLDGLGVRAEPENSPPETLADRLDSHWESR